MKYFIIAGEASGDLHASNLIKAIQKKDSQAEFHYLGGDLMAQATDQKPLIHYRDMAFMGVIDVIKNLKTIYQNLQKTKKAILSYQPDVVVLVDYPGFNLKIAEFAKKNGFKTVYYISPKLWAWKEGRVRKIRKYIDKLLVILPFEIDFYKKHKIEAKYVGNPVVDAVQNHQALPKEDFLNKFNLNDKPILALLPGSRKQEIKMMLPEMLAVTQNFPDFQFVISGAPGLRPEEYQKYTKGFAHIPVIFNHTYDLLANSHSAIVTSGTAALETALFKIPQIVVYKTYNWQYAIGKHLVKIAFFSLPNLIMQREIIPELLQHQFSVKQTTAWLQQINAGTYRNKMLQDYEALIHLLGNESAAEKAASEILSFLKAT